MAQWEFLAATFHLGSAATSPETRGFDFTRHPDLERKLAALTDEGWELVTIDVDRRWILMRRETTHSAEVHLQQDSSVSALVGPENTSGVEGRVGQTALFGEPAPDRPTAAPRGIRSDRP